ncbi:MAG: LacI family DNA-binding transcriptional regulator [Clostridia bacterium]|nr:LacI family DNA-binding transcriptional regulator [Clostridia bacterium]
MQKITLEKIAADMGVSKVAVYKALNDKKGVSDALREKIKIYADSLGYVGKSSETDIKNKKYLFFVNQDFFLTPSEQFYSPISYFLSAECTKTNSFLQIAFLENTNTVEKMKEVINTFVPNGLFVAGQTKPEVLKYLSSCRLPIVYIDYYSPIYNLHYIYVDNYNSSYMLTKYLIDNGHKKIGFVGNVSVTSSIADRFFGYRKALCEYGIKFDPVWHIDDNLEKNNNLSDVLPESIPTAYVCHCDAAAQKLYTALSLKGLKIPDDVSVVSFDDTPLCDNLFPALTSIGPKKDVFAKKAFNTMIDALNEKSKCSAVPIKAVLTKRDSVKELD